MISHCPTCKRAFRTNDSRQKNCTVQCRDKSYCRIDEGKLRRFAFMGADLAAMAVEFGVTACAVRRALARTGLHGQWREQRFA